MATVAELKAAVDNTAVAHILVQSGTYTLDSSHCTDSGDSGLCIKRSVRIEAAVTGAVVFDASAAGFGSCCNPNRRTVLVSPPSSSDEVHVIGVNITGGTKGGGGSGGGVRVEEGTVAFTDTNIYRNEGDPGGGGVSIGGGHVTFRRCRIFENNFQYRVRSSTHLCALHLRMTALMVFLFSVPIAVCMTPPSICSGMVIPG